MLSWVGGDPDVGDTVTYAVYFGSTPPLQQVTNNLSTPSFNPGNLSTDSTYLWHIVAMDNHGVSTDSPSWQFTTSNKTNRPPDKPSTPVGQSTGKVGTEYSYSSSAVDPDGDKVYLLFDWGDGNDSGWLGPYNSSVSINITHKWDVKGSYSIKVNARDIYGVESAWSDSLPVTMPSAFILLRQVLERLFQQHPHAFPLLRYLLDSQHNKL
jgi:hypothetical protein